MTSFVVMNPGTGPVGGANAREARRNIGAFCRELDLPSPHVRIERRPSGDDGQGRYDFMIYRGIRSVSVEMPGLPLDRVALRPNGNARHFPRLYVDGSSWLWPFALNSARRDLIDHDGSAERGYRQSVADCDFVMANDPCCPTCGSIKDRYHTDLGTENLPYGYDRIRCIVCKAVEKTEIRSWNLESVYNNDSWKTLRHGCVYRVTSRLMPYEAIGTDDDPICTIGYYSNRQCRLKQRHDGACAPRWKEISRDRIDLPYRGDL